MEFERFVQTSTSEVAVGKPGEQPLRAPEGQSVGRKPKLLRRDADHQPPSVEDLAMALPAEAWKTVWWRQGVKKKRHSRFAAVRIHAPDRLRSAGGAEAVPPRQRPQTDSDVTPSAGDSETLPAKKLLHAARRRKVGYRTAATFDGIPDDPWPRVSGTRFSDCGPAARRAQSLKLSESALPLVITHENGGVPE